MPLMTESELNDEEPDVKPDAEPVPTGRSNTRAWGPEAMRVGTSFTRSGRTTILPGNHEFTMNFSVRLRTS